MDGMTGPSTSTRPKLSEIKQVICTRYRVSLSELIGPCRRRNLAGPRQLAMFLARQLTLASYPQIARDLGGRDHSTILFGDRKIRRLLVAAEANSALAGEVEACTADILALAARRAPVVILAPSSPVDDFTAQVPPRPRMSKARPRMYAVAEMEA